MDEDYDDYDDEERPDRVRSALLTGLVALALIAVLIAIGTTIFVHSLGLDQSGPTGPVGAAEPSATPLPTKALAPRSGKASSSPPSPPPSSIEKQQGARRGDIKLSATPLIAKPMERINLTGTYGGKDNVGLEVQRWEAGGWVDFGVSTTVRVGTFETYVMTGRRGDNRFRVYDPQAHNGSNPVLITID